MRDVSTVPSPASEQFGLCPRMDAGPSSTLPGLPTPSRAKKGTLEAKGPCSLSLPQTPESQVSISEGFQDAGLCPLKTVGTGQHCISNKPCHGNQSSAS